jgi:hypothetical protein
MRGNYTRNVYTSMRRMVSNLFMQKKLLVHCCLFSCYSSGCRCCIPSEACREVAVFPVVRCVQLNLEELRASEVIFILSVVVRADDVNGSQFFVLVLFFFVLVLFFLVLMLFMLFFLPVLGGFFFLLGLG